MRKTKLTIKKSVTAVKKIEQNRLDTLYEKVSLHVDKARETIYRTVDFEIVKAYWLMGRDIVQEEQAGEKKAAYGSALLSVLSERLTEKYGRGFSVSTLKDIRQFYLVYPHISISHAVRGESKNYLNQNLGWVHYRALMRVQQSAEARKFYEIEAENNHWSGRELERQIDSLLFERLLKSRDKKGLMKLAKKGQEILTPKDAIKDPIILEFLGIPEAHQLVESKLEDAIISNLQNFLLELGKGFAFVARQKRLTLDGDHYYADLVFFHTILKCHIIIDLKTRKLTHGDLGQMQLYVNYYDKEIASADDNPTIGLILCTRKSDAMVKYMLGDKAKRIFASKYQFHLPTEKELEAELKREIRQISGKN